MKNINEELHKLGRYEYTVSENFSQKVMKRIQKDKFSTKVKQVIPFASLTVAACLVVMICTKTGVGDTLNRSAFSQEVRSGEISRGQESMNINSLDTNQMAGDEVKKEWSEESKWDTSGMLSNVQGGTQNDLQKGTQNVAQSAMPNSTLDENKEVNRVENDRETQVDSLNTFSIDNKISLSSEISNQEKQEILLSTLKQAGYQVEVTEGGLKVKAKMETIQDLLEDVVNLEEQGEWVMIKF